MTPHTDVIPGGKADTAHPSHFDPDQLARGIKVEMEHTNDPKVAREIAMDHLKEDPKYYDKLAKIHKESLFDQILNDLEEVRLAEKHGVPPHLHAALRSSGFQVLTTGTRGTTYNHQHQRDRVTVFRNGTWAHRDHEGNEHQGEGSQLGQHLKDKGLYKANRGALHLYKRTLKVQKRLSALGPSVAPEHEKIKRAAKATSEPASSRVASRMWKGKTSDPGAYDEPEGGDEEEAPVVHDKEFKEPDQLIRTAHAQLRAKTTAATLDKRNQPVPLGGTTDPETGQVKLNKYVASGSKGGRPRKNRSSPTPLNQAVEAAIRKRRRRSYDDDDEVRGRAGMSVSPSSGRMRLQLGRGMVKDALGENGQVRVPKGRWNRERYLKGVRNFFDPERRPMLPPEPNGHGQTDLDRKLRRFKAYRREEKETMNATQMIDAVTSGKKTIDKVLDEVTQPHTNYNPQGDAQAAPGGDRRDDITDSDSVANAFSDIIARVSGAYPYIDMGWVDKVVVALRAGANPAEISQMAKVNRDDYIAQGFKVDAGGGASTWDAIYNSMIQSFTTDTPSGGS